MDAALSRITSSAVRPSLDALRWSRNRVRSVSIRPGTMTLAVTPSRPTSSAMVFDHECRLARSVFDSPRFGIGLIAPDDVDVRMRPNHVPAYLAAHDR